MNRLIFTFLILLTSVSSFADRWVEMHRQVDAYNFTDKKPRRFIFQAFSRLNLPPDAASAEIASQIDEIHTLRLNTLEQRKAFEVPNLSPYTPYELEMFVDQYENLRDHDEIVVMREVHPDGNFGGVVFMMAKSYGAALVGKNFQVNFDGGEVRTINRNEPAARYPTHWTRDLKVATEAGLNMVSEVGGVAQMNAYITMHPRVGGLEIVSISLLGMKLAYDVGFLTENEVVKDGVRHRVASRYLLQETWGRAKERHFDKMGFHTIEVEAIGDGAYEHVAEAKMPYKPGTDIPNRLIPGHTIRIGKGKTLDLITANVPSMAPADIIGFSRIVVGKSISQRKSLTIPTLQPVTLFGGNFSSGAPVCDDNAKLIASSYSAVFAGH